MSDWKPKIHLDPLITEYNELVNKVSEQADLIESQEAELERLTGMCNDQALLPSEDKHPLEYDLCDEHEWAGLSGCPKCEEEERRADYIQGQREDEKLSRKDRHDK
jgi:hypothetical protein